MRRILCLHLPHLSTDRLRRRLSQRARENAAPGSQPGAAGTDDSGFDRRVDGSSGFDNPLVLTRRTGGTVRITGGCATSQVLGIFSGMTLGQAQAVAPHLLSFEESPREDAECLRKLAEWALCLSPLVEPAFPASLLLDVTGAVPLLGSEQSIARRALGGLGRQGFEARAAVAGTIGAAWALAEFGGEPLIVAESECAGALLSRLPPESLRLDSQTLESLGLLGIRTVGDLLMLPRSALASRFGPQVVLRLDQALGQVFEALSPHEPPPILQKSRRFEAPVAEPLVIRACIADLAGKLINEVLRRGLGMRRLDIVLYFGNEPPRLQSISLSRGTCVPGHILRLIDQRLEQCDFGESLIALRVVAGNTPRRTASAQELFEPAADSGESLGMLVDNLANRLGHDALVRPRAMDEHLPEWAFRYVSVAEAGLEEQPPRTESTRTRGPRSRPKENRSPALSHATNSGERTSTTGTGAGETPTHAAGATTPAATGGDVLNAPPGLAARDARCGSNRLASAIPSSPPCSPLPSSDKCPQAGGVPPWGGDLTVPLWIEAEAAEAGGGASSCSTDLIEKRPLRLLDPPMSTRMIALFPDGPPRWFTYAGRDVLVARSSGPERIETGWWRGTDEQRDYYCVLAESGEQYWVFRDRVSGQWFVHGLFV